MEIGAVNNLTNLSFSQSSTNEEPEALNAFGIGAANAPEVELSPQARILQQNEQAQSERREAFEQNRNPEEGEEQQQVAGREFIRVSSSVGSSAARNNLSSERAAEVYRSIQELL